MEPDHPFVITRLAGVFLCALPAVRELYQYINDPRCGATISLFTLYRSSSFVIFTRSCALQENSENGAARLANARYNWHRAISHCQVEQRPVSCSVADARTDRLVDWGGTVGTLSTQSGECSRKLVVSRRLLKAPNRGSCSTCSLAYLSFADVYGGVCVYQGSRPNDYLLFGLLYFFFPSSDSTLPYAPCSPFMLDVYPCIIISLCETYSAL